jgi:hypothetical protein
MRFHPDVHPIALENGVDQMVAAQPVEAVHHLSNVMKMDSV